MVTGAAVVGDVVGFAETVGAFVVGLVDGATVVGALVGASVGAFVVGASVGAAVVGAAVGAAVVGAVDGFSVSPGTVGTFVVGLVEGATVVGGLVGAYVGAAVVGARVGPDDASSPALTLTVLHHFVHTPSTSVPPSFSPPKCSVPAHPSAAFTKNPMFAICVKSVLPPPCVAALPV